jgi:hypothetical protein
LTGQRRLKGEAAVSLLKNMSEIEVRQLIGPVVDISTSQITPSLSIDSGLAQPVQFPLWPSFEHISSLAFASFSSPGEFANRGGNRLAAADCPREQFRASSWLYPVTSDPFTLSVIIFAP